MASGNQRLLALNFSPESIFGEQRRLDDDALRRIARTFEAACSSDSGKRRCVRQVIVRAGPVID
jgi:hypothetical protein